MKRFFSTFLILLGLVMGAAGVAPVAHAATVAECAEQFSNGGNDYNACIATAPGVSNCADQFPNGGPDYDTCISGIASGATAAPVIDPAAAAAPIQPDNPIKNDAAYASVIQWIMKLFAWLVGVAAITLDNAVYYTVVTMGDYVKNLAAVGVTWRILRDIGNILLIFGFLAVGITTILNVDWYGGGKKMLPMMLVAAVFLNFSLFISEAIIDTGNLFATQFYTQINGGNPAGAKNFDLVSISNDGISNKIMAQLGLQGIYGAALSPNTEIFKAGNSWIIGFMGIILFIVTAFVMFSLAFVLIARFVALIFLIIVAPIGFAGLAVPGFAARAKQYWTTLFEQTITAPILLLMLYIALAVITDAKFMTGFGSSSNSSGWTGYIRDATGTANLTGFAGLLLSFLVAMGLLLAVTVYAKRWSAFGGDWATRTAGKLTFGATAWTGRTTAGWGANRAAKYLRGTWVGRTPLVGTGLVKGLDRVAGGSFDLRGTDALKKMPFGSSIDVGTAQKGGYKADLKSRIESRTKYAGELRGEELTVDEKAKQTALQNEIKKLQKEIAKPDTGVDRIKTIGVEIEKAEKDLEKIESKTDKGAQRKYATVLELGLNSKGTFNTIFNFAANTEAAKAIRAGAKKGKPDKDWSANMRKLLKDAAEESGEEAGARTGPTTPPPTAPATPPSSAPPAAPGGETPPAP